MAKETKATSRMGSCMVDTVVMGVGHDLLYSSFVSYLYRLKRYTKLKGHFDKRQNNMFVCLMQLLNFSVE